MIRGSDLKVVVIIYVSVRAFYAYVWMLSRLSISDFGYQSNDYKDKSREAKKCTVWLYMMERWIYNIAELRILHDLEHTDAMWGDQKRLLEMKHQDTYMSKTQSITNEFRMRWSREDRKDLHFLETTMCLVFWQ